MTFNQQKNNLDENFTCYEGKAAELFEELLEKGVEQNDIFIIYLYALYYQQYKKEREDVIQIAINGEHGIKSFSFSFHNQETIKQNLTRFYQEYIRESKEVLNTPSIIVEVVNSSKNSTEEVQNSKNLLFYIRFQEDGNILYSFNNSCLTWEDVNYYHQHIVHIINQVLSQSESFWKDVAIITEDEMGILAEFNQTKRNYPKDMVVSMFQRQVSAHPDKLAVIIGEQAVTYRELDRKSNQIAHYLRKRGIEPNDFVAIIPERSVEMIAGIIGIIKAGAAYVPIDPRYPQKRIDFILSDCHAKIILTNIEQFIPSISIPVIQLNSKVFEEVNAKEIDLINQQSDAVYAIYTSGTTGKPKGVVIEHRNLVNLIYAYEEVYSMTDKDIILQFASIAFDQSVLEIFSALLLGGTLCIVPYSMITNVTMLENYIMENQVSWIGLTPAYLRELEFHKLTSVRLIESGGAAADIDILNQWRQEKTIFNTYGPTETTVNATSYELIEELQVGTRMPIGKPMPNAQLYILDGLNECGIGIPGELCIGGDGVARGYLNREELTREKFIDNPFGEGRLYRSGDLAMWLPDGNIDYLGRIDEQVKIRGFRIELGEIENILKKQVGVKDGTVIVRKDSSNENCICAYVICEEATDFTPEYLEGIKKSMCEELPHYMIPTYFIEIKEMPLTTNGKVDKSSLLQYELKKNVHYEEPKTETQRKLAKIFEQVFQITCVGLKENFFELGGHSLKATKMIHLIEDELQKVIVMKEIFLHPTVEELAGFLEGKETVSKVAIKHSEKKERYAISPLQKGIYLIQQMSQDTTTYNVPERVKLTGELHYERLVQAYRQLIERHDILRVTFEEVNGEIYQKVNESIDSTVVHKELKEEKLEKEFQQFVRPFSLKDGPLIRMEVVTYSEDAHMLFLDIHHIIADGTSVEILLEELAALYNGETLDAPSRTYLDYSEWQKDRNYETEKEYWVGLLKNDIPVLDIPLDHMRPTEQSFRGEIRKTVLSKELREKVLLLTKETNTTEYMFFLSAFMVLLSKYARNEDIIVGSPYAGRTARETESMIGMFVNTIALKGNPAKNKSFASFLEEIRIRCMEAYENQELPFEQLVSEVIEKRDLSRNPIFDVMFAMQNFDVSLLKFNGMKVKRCLEEESDMSKFDLSLDVTEIEGEYVLLFEYCTDLFNRETIDYLMEHYQALVEEILEDRNRLIGSYTCMGAKEQAMLQEEFNNTDRDFDLSVTAMEIFEKQATSNPDKIAVMYEDQSITYQELNEKANYVAKQLQEYGVQANDFVVILPQRSIEMIIGIFGILKAGGAYVPIDPTYPLGRIEYILENCHAKAAVVVKEHLELTIPVPVYRLDDKDALGRAENLGRISGPEDLAYSIYTSGTTGKPKGVMIAQSNLVNLLYAYEELYDLTEEDTVLQFASISFDQSVWDIFNIICVGGTLCLMPYDLVGNVPALEQYMIDHHVTVSVLTPAFLREINVERLPQLRMIESGGAAAEYEVLQRCFACGKRIFNTYGPTEATVNAITYELSGEEKEKIPIGRPMPNAKVYVLQEDTLCGIGVPGELCIAGKGVGRGYINQPELTDSKFIKNAFGEGRLYRTGDLVRWLPDGEIDYLGRIDEQVKIRGFRIELGEVENVLKRQDGVTNAAVVVKKVMDGEPALCAYFTADTKLEVATLRTAMKKEVPDYMVPAFFMQIEQMPVTKNGKLDTKALPDMDLNVEREYVEAATEMERLVVKVFEEVLGLEKVSATDNFFEIGGHSLKATRLVNQLEELTKKNVLLREIFKASTPQLLAALIESKEDNSYEPIPKVSKKEYYPMSAAQRRIFMVEQLGEESIAYNMPESLELRGALDVDRLREAYQSLVNRHEVLRTRFLLIDGEPVQKIEENVTVTVSYCKAEESEHDTLYREFVKPFTLEQLPLIRMEVVQIEQERFYLFIDVHHIVVDGVTWEQLLEELSILYNGGTLPALTVQYKDYSEWMLRRDLSGQKKYWDALYEGDVPILDMPLDYQRPKEQSFQGDMLILSGYEQEKRAVEALCKRTGTTEYMVLMGTYMVLLGKYSRQEDIIVGTPMAGRTHRDTENMAGMFVNTIAMRGKPEKEKTFLEFLEDVRKSSVKAFENQEYPFEELIEAIGLKRDMSRNPLFDVMFVLQNQGEEKLSLDGVTAREKIDAEYKVSKFDLTLNMGEAEDGYQLIFEYCTALFCKESVERFAKHYIQLLREVCQTPEKKIGELTCMDSEELTKVIETFNQTDMPYPKGMTMPQMFSEQVAKGADRIAVVHGEDRLTYGQLESMSDSLAAVLREQGVKRGDHVALLTERGVRMVAGILGIQKAGAAYVPMDPHFPRERLEYMIEDCKPTVIVSGREKADIEVDLPTISLYDEMNWNRTWDGDGPAANDVAYIIYTSGTTGRPKGVMVEHEGVANLREYFKTVQGVNMDDRSLQFANIVFDAAISEFCMSILSGGIMYIVPEEQKQDPEKLSQYLKDEKITIAVLPPQFAAQLDVSGLRALITAGSEASQELAIEKGKQLFYSNDYGPTEATVCATHWDCEGAEVPDRVPIGRPIGNKKIYILNGDVPCGIGIPGELCITGTGIARGYLNLEELTKERFAANPYGGGRMYRSGDLARWKEDGNIEFLGRIDDQVKVRGYRIELGEIESVAGRQAGIEEVCAMIRKPNGTDAAIVLYYTGEEAQEESLKEGLRRALPDYMFPSYFMKLEKIPVNQSGKPDKKALPEIEYKAGADYVEPETREEKILAAIMEEVLGIERIGAEDEFFELGGDSIKAIRIVSKLREEGMTVEIRDIMTGKTVREIGKRILKPEQMRTYSQEEWTGETELLPIQREFLNEWQLAKPEHFNQAMAVKSKEFDREAMHASLRKLTEHHDMLRAVLQDGKLIVQPFEGSEHYTYEEIDAGALEGAELEAFAQKEFTRVQEGIDLEHGPLCKVALLKTAKEEHLLLCVHHMVVDGVSFRILLEDFEEGYLQYRKNKTIKLPAKTASFKEWADAVKAYADDASDEAEYWNDIVDRADFANLEEEWTKRDKIEVYEFEEDASFTRELMKKYSIDIQDILLSGLVCAVANCTGQDEVLIQLEGHGREKLTEDIDVSRTVGWFTTSYPILLKAGAQAEDTLLATKENIRAINNHGIAFGCLKAAGKVEQDTVTNISFNYLGEFQTDHGDQPEKEIMDSELPTGQSTASANIMQSSFIMTGYLLENTLHYSIVYNAGKYSKALVTRIAEEYSTAHQAMIEAKENRSESVQTLSDIDSAGISDDTLQQINNLADLLF